jgi:twitching motility protein PilT
VAVISQVLLKKKAGVGRIAALEIMIGTTAVKNLIREGKTHQIPSVLQPSHKMGMQHMDQVIRNLVTSGKVDVSEAKMFISNQDLLDERPAEVGQASRGGVSGMAAVSRLK